ncbi:hypothetical protein [Methanothermococcus okinawensis]|uniref:Uncharacterized protein n=1 Tax=Methanothermococcus okinawensis (strain DSM 14208 / JCM 11175 / IH1) TaxID=647113 RepID=F8AL12_METOI|nr:hypothetical protein [Methanothermococcus okinawensis]AEH06447.1 hypothetical protein Metok_0465 [Methanothermococcus okinawensis IH1]
MIKIYYPKTTKIYDISEEQKYLEASMEKIITTIKTEGINAILIANSKYDTYKKITTSKPSNMLDKKLYPHYEKIYTTVVNNINKYKQNLENQEFNVEIYNKPLNTSAPVHDILKRYGEYLGSFVLIIGMLITLLMLPIDFVLRVILKKENSADKFFRYAPLKKLAEKSYSYEKKDIIEYAKKLEDKYGNIAVILV